MPITIQLRQLVVCAVSLDGGGPTVLGPNVRAQLFGGKLTITENGNVVFHMKVRVRGSLLELDYPRTTNGHEGRGWGRLGMLLALRYGLHKGCTTVTAGTQLEPDSYGFWAFYGIQFSLQSNLRGAIIKTMLWINKKVPQPHSSGTSVMIILDPKDGESNVPTMKKKNSF